MLGVCGGSNYLDDCEICNDTSQDDNQACIDCADIPNGTALEDNCGVCDSDSTNDCLQDCAGIWGGLNLLDACGECGGVGDIYECGCSIIDNDENVDFIDDLDEDGDDVCDYITSWDQITYDNDGNALLTETVFDNCLGHANTNQFDYDEDDEGDDCDLDIDNDGISNDSDDCIFGEIGVGGGRGHVIEYTGEAIRSMSMDGRMTICNMTIEGGGRAGMVAPDKENPITVEELAVIINPAVSEPPPADNIVTPSTSN